jgi:nucleotide-binding universal stress UspA family protein
MPESSNRSYASIMVHVDLTEAASRRVGLARTLAARFGARLIGIASEEPLTAYDGGALLYVSTSVAHDEQLRVRKDLATAEGMFRASAGSGEDVEWRCGEASATRFLLAQSRIADLVLVGRQSAEDEMDPRLGIAPGDAVMGLGRPMLLVPPNLRELEGRRIVLAWKDSREARRALTDSLPFLQRADDVFIVAVGGASGSAEDVAAHLKRQRVPAPRVVRVTQTTTVFTHLLEIADGEGVDLIVAGAFGHSRVREWTFGGVTQEMLSTSPACCLLSH